MCLPCWWVLVLIFKLKINCYYFFEELARIILSNLEIYQHNLKSDITSNQIILLCLPSNFDIFNL